MGEIGLCYRIPGRKEKIDHSGGERSCRMRLYINEKEVPTLISAIESYISLNPQSAEAQELLSRIYVCLEKQGKNKAKKTL